MKRWILLLIATVTVSAYAAEQITIAQFLNRKDESTTYRLRGVVKNITNTVYGNFDLVDNTGSVYIWGLKDANGNTQQFASMDIAENDTVTLEGVYFLYNNTKVEIQNAQYISHDKYKWTPVPSTIADFISKNDGNIYIITGKVTEIQNDYYGNFVLRDETGSIIVWGLVDENGSKVFSSSDIQLGDTVTVEGRYTLYEDPNTHEKKHEIKNALFVSRVIVLPSDGIYFPASFRKGWDMYINQTLNFKTPFYIVDLTGSWDSVIIASDRLRIADEWATGLSNGDSTAYKQIAARNAEYKISLKGFGDGYFKSDTIRTGAIITNLKATVTAERVLHLNDPWVLVNNTPPTAPPAMPNVSLIVCGTNIENYYTRYGSSSNGAKSDEQFNAQTAKIASALVNINADIYAMCEVEMGTAALAALSTKMNELVGTDRYSYVDNGLAEATADNQAGVGYIYRKDKVAPTTTAPYFPYSTTYPEWYKRLIIREFKELSSNETFAVSINHFKSKVSSWETTQAYNVTNLINGLSDIMDNNLFANDRILVLGDFNSYTYEKTIQSVIAHSLSDILPHGDPLNDYSYVYQGETGYLDRAFASEELEEYIVDVQPYHINTDFAKRRGYKYSDTSIYRYADHDPILVGINFSETSTSVEKTESETSATKVMIGNTLYIMYNGVRYTVMGQKVDF